MFFVKMIFFNPRPARARLSLFLMFELVFKSLTNILKNLPPAGARPSVLSHPLLLPPLLQVGQVI